MFETATFSYGPPTKRVWTTAMGFTGQAMLIGCALLAPMISPQTLGRALLVTTLVTPGAPPPPPPPGPRVVPRSSRAVATQISNHTITLPVNVPAIAAIIVDDPPETAGGGPGVPGSTGGVTDGVRGAVPSIIDSVVSMVPVFRPPEAVNRATVAATPVPVKPPRITQLRMATPIHKVDPIYPQIAKQARVSGTVELLGVLGTDGRIHELRVLRGHPLLVGAALDAVRQWIFEPTLLNGQAVEVAAPITVNFILNQ